MINRIKVEFSNFYIGITKEILNDSYLELHTYLKGLGLEEVGLLDTRYLDDSDIESYHILDAISKNKVLKDMHLEDVDYQLYSKKEYLSIFEKYPYLIKNNETITRVSTFATGGRIRKFFLSKIL